MSMPTVCSQHTCLSCASLERLQASFPDSRHVSAAARPTGIPVWIRILGLLIVSCASHRSQPGVPLTPLATSASVKQGVFAARSGRGVHASPLSAADGRIGDAISDEPRGDVIASLHCYSLMQVSSSQRRLGTRAGRLASPPRLGVCRCCVCVDCASDPQVPSVCKYGTRSRCHSRRPCVRRVCDQPQHAGSTRPPKPQQPRMHTAGCTALGTGCVCRLKRQRSPPPPAAGRPHPLGCSNPRLTHPPTWITQVLCVLCAVHAHVGRRSLGRLRRSRVPDGHSRAGTGGRGVWVKSRP